MFSGLIGQQAAKARLGRQVAAGAARNAYLFAGESGLGKLAFALAFAKALVCAPGAGGGSGSGVGGGSGGSSSGSDVGGGSGGGLMGVPCGVCVPCRLFDSGATDDFLLIGALQQANKNVPEQGYANASQQGYANATQQGYANASQQGYANASQQGYANASQQGYANASQQGYANASQQGYANASQQGFADAAFADAPQAGDVGTSQLGHAVASQARSISVSEIRALSDWASTKPTYSARKACVIADADRMTTQAQNALLKTLEEPPGYVSIILTSARAEALLETVRSRCEAVRFARYCESECVDILASLGMSAEDALFAARMSAGAPGRIAGRVDLREYLGLRDQAIELLGGLIDGDDAASVAFVGLMERRKDEFYDIVDLFIACLRDMWIIASTHAPMAKTLMAEAPMASVAMAEAPMGKTLVAETPMAEAMVAHAPLEPMPQMPALANEDRRAAIAAMAGRVGVAQTLDCIGSLGDIRASVARNANYALAANVMLLRLCELRGAVAPARRRAE